MYSDDELVDQVKQGDREAFGLLYQRYGARLRALFASFGCRFDEAQDLTQETFLGLWLARAEYEPRGEFVGYLFKIARNCWLGMLRKGRGKPQEIPVEQSDDIRSRAEQAMLHLKYAENVPEEAILADYRKWRVQQAVGSLPEPYREVLVLVHLQGLKYQEAADELGIPIGTVKSRLSTAIGMLRERLKEEQL